MSLDKSRYVSVLGQDMLTVTIGVKDVSARRGEERRGEERRGGIR